MGLRPATTRSLSAILARLLLVRTTLLLLAFGTLFVGHNLGATLSSDDLVSPIDPRPAWTATDTARFPDCEPMAKRDRTRIPQDVVVHRHRDDRHLRLDFARAWALNHNATESDDLHVLGACG